MTIGKAKNQIPSSYINFQKETISEIQEGVKPYLNQALAWGALPDVDQLYKLENPGDLDYEYGYSTSGDDSNVIAVKTLMPNTSPEMWNWWFGWHGSENARYKLWHPKAHISVRWADGNNNECYIGRTSIIKEYIGSELLEAAIQFKSPLNFGFSYDAVNHNDKEVYICANIGHPKLPVDYGLLVHQVRQTSRGTEMRSRFFVGGKYVSARNENFLSKMAIAVLKRFKSLPKNFAQDLMLHCAEEMNHLASILPQLYKKYGGEEKVAISGSIISDNDEGFEKAVMDTLFNKAPINQRPKAIYEPKTIEDIINVVRYAKRVGRRLSVTSGGHSFSASFIRDEALLIDMKHFNEFVINVEEKTAEAGPAVGGSDLMKSLYKNDLFFPAGHCQGVCLGGYLLQGGYGWNGRKLGVACESILGLDVVTAEGELVYADTNNNSDLFWAARGSGAGFFGIVVKFYLRVYDLPKYRAVIVHDFKIRYLEDVYRWAHEVGPSVPKAVEFQMLMTRNMMNMLGPGIEAVAPIFADSKEEFEDSKAFMKNSPIAKKAMIRTPSFNPGISMLYKTVQSHYPDNYCWGVDNMWTHSSIDELLPYLKKISETLPPAPSHFLWLNWHPGKLNTEMAYSKEDQVYLSAYSCWKNPDDTSKYGQWASEMMREMEHLSTGIQLADEGLHKRTFTFMEQDKLKKVDQIRSKYDPSNIFHEWHSKPGRTA
ncbi:MAG: FAD-binding protein [Bacteroidota bacterium]